jgi:hypothetical protein
LCGLGVFVVTLGVPAVSDLSRFSVSLEADLLAVVTNGKK